MSSQPATNGHASINTALMDNKGVIHYPIQDYNGIFHYPTLDNDGNVIDPELIVTDPIARISLVAYKTKTGRPHRKDGPAIIHSNGNEEWWLNGKQHREEKPAIETFNGYKAWYKHGMRHNSNGPAIVHPDGTVEFFVDGKEQKTPPTINID